MGACATACSGPAAAFFRDLVDAARPLLAYSCIVVRPRQLELERVAPALAELAEYVAAAPAAALELDELFTEV